ncbi:BMP family ABC transporter substrate-binding protein, partial [Senegalia massiliensis]|nr:BMP family ABC transporter substrate-binding protein [Senegalia massiliensis]
MKKGKLVSLLSLLIIVSLIASGCGKTKSKSTSGENTYHIGISQLVEHPALDDARRGFE